MVEKANCRVCGKEFTPCKGIAGIPQEHQPLNWRKICCSVPCGSQFINSILESRGLMGYGVPSEPADVEVADSVTTATEEPEPVAKPRRQRKPAPKQEVPQEKPEEAAEPAEEGTE